MTSTTTAEQRIRYKDRDNDNDEGVGDPSYYVPLGPNGGRQNQRRPSSPSSQSETTGTRSGTGVLELDHSNNVNNGDKLK